MQVGQSAESFAWAAVFHADAGERCLLSDRQLLPHWLQGDRLGLPPAYIFEGMRAILAEKTVHWDMLALAFGLSVVYLIDAASRCSSGFFRSSRRAPVHCWAKAK